MFAEHCSSPAIDKDVGRAAGGDRLTKLMMQLTLLSWLRYATSSKPAAPFVPSTHEQ
jgi:hypothetical protein